MENDAPSWPALGEGHVQGIFDQLGAHVVGNGPANYPAVSQVDDRRHVGEAGPRPDVSDVADVAGVHLGRRAEMVSAKHTGWSCSGDLDRQGRATDDAQQFVSGDR
jgi:hypothetical protein